jgi:cell division protein ZapA
MDEISIKVTIAKRQYPLKIQRADEERIRRAEKLLNDRITEYEQQYSASEKLDILTMCALQFASELVNFTEDTKQSASQASDAITAIDRMIAERIRLNNVH